MFDIYLQSQHVSTPYCALICQCAEQAVEAAREAELKRKAVAVEVRCCRGCVVVSRPFTTAQVCMATRACGYSCDCVWCLTMQHMLCQVRHDMEEQLQQRRHLQQLARVRLLTWSLPSEFLRSLQQKGSWHCSSVMLASREARQPRM